MQFKMCVDWYVEQRLTLDKVDKKEAQPGETADQP